MAKTTKRTKRTTSKKAASKKTPKTAPKRNDLKRLKATYPHVQSIASENEKGKALRVVIRCSNEYGLDDCAETREIATQDAFQVSRCAPCQREFSKRRRRKNPDA
jgi:hypothetical protein